MVSSVGALHCVLGQDTVSSKCLTSSRCIWVLFGRARGNPAMDYEFNYCYCEVGNGFHIHGNPM